MTGNQILVDRSLVLPIMETKQLAVGTSSKDKHHGHDDKTNDANHLDRRESELHFTVNPNRKTVQYNKKNNKDCNPYSHTHWRAPILNYKACGRYLSWYRDSKDIAVHPAQGKP
ncbi:unnamed protein product [Aspergillus oryzae]|nr:unnamed protein product [Aspergillus oryzae]